MRYIEIIAALAMVPAMAIASKPSKEPIDIGVEPTFEQIKKEVEPRTADQLVDPESARFKYPYATISEKKKGIPGWTTCAMVNSKNRMGGYGGYQIVLIRFVKSEVTFFNIVDDDTGSRKFMCGDMPAREVTTD